jgi:hypothetical protein
MPLAIQKIGSPRSAPLGLPVLDEEAKPRSLMNFLRDMAR